MVSEWIKEECSDCHGEKVVYCGGVAFKCSTCHGKGFIWKNSLEGAPPDRVFL